MKPRMLAFLAALALTAQARSTLDLSGTWRFRIDREDAGLAAAWFASALPDRIRLPGSLPEQGIGDLVALDTKWVGGIADRSFFTQPEYEAYRQPGNIKLPFWLTPERHYVGAAWFQRDIEIPADWRDKRVVLSLERPHWETRVWIDGRIVGTNNALATPHDYDLGRLLPGKHALTIRVDNRVIVDVGENSHSISDHTQGNWNGIAGRIELRATPLVWIENVVLVPDFTNKLLRGIVQIGNATGKGGSGKIRWDLRLGDKQNNAFEGNTGLAWSASNRTETIVLCSFGAVTWDEFSPRLFDFDVAITAEDGTADTWRMRTGVREFKADGTQFTINGRPTFIRGTLDCCIYPRTGYPPTDVAEWKRIIGVAKAHGLNLIRFHSWCPPEAAFVAADELGFYFHIEASSWANQSTTIGDGKPVDQWIYEETDRILKYYGNHPSFILMPYGNEPGGKNHKAYLAKWVEHYKAKDPRRLWSSGAGWPELPENEWHCVPGPRIQAWGGGLKSIINAQPPQTLFDFRDYIQKRNVPVVSHEIGQWCVYPNFDEMKKYTGYLKPRNFEIFRDRLAAHHLLDQARDFLLASGKLQALCYKADIEAALRTPGMAGFQLLDLHDFPGQGTALVGVLDPFWEEKGYITPAGYKRFCNAVVPLARLPKHVFTSDERLEAEVEVAHFGHGPFKGAVASWTLVGDDGGSLRGEFPKHDVPIGNGTRLGKVSVSLAGLKAPARYTLSIKLGETSPLSPDGYRGHAVENDWDVWVYPPQLPAEPADVKIADSLSDETLAALNAGARVLLAIPPKRVKNDAKNKVVLGFSSIFWNTAWTHRQPPTTLGILCDPKHPALAAFPTDFHSNWQWWYVIHRAAPMILDEMPPELKPTVQVIDDWFTARKLGLVFEANVGRGNLLVTSVDLATDIANDPVRRQLRSSLLAYAASDRFQPKCEVPPEKIRALVGASTDSRLVMWGAQVVSTDSEAPTYTAANAIDGDPDTIWHTAWEPSPKPMPHEVVIDLKAARKIAGLRYLPRQDMVNGRIGKYEVRLSADGKTWTTPVATGQWPNDAAAQTVAFPEQSARYVKVVALSEVQGKDFAAIAELDIIEGK